jgi:hypothetical protein
MARTYAYINVNGVDYDGTSDRVINVLVNKVIDVAASSFEARFWNLNGQFKDAFTIGDDVTIYHDSVSPPVQKVFRGFIEEVAFEVEPNNREVCIIKGRDYTARLFDYTVQRTFNDSEASSIVTTIMAEIPEITLNNVQVTSKTFDQLKFRHTPIADALKLIADNVAFRVFVDEDKDLHFEPISTSSTGVTLNNTNCMFAEIKTNSNEMFNKIIVYGARYLSGYSESFTANGGSTYTLAYEPHNMTVLLDNTIKIGAVLNQSVTAPSGAQYWTDFNGKQIIWVSGTGNYPTSGTSIIKADYHRQLPIVKIAQDLEAQRLYGTKTKVVVDRNIVDPRMAKDLALLELANHGRPVFGGRAQLHSSVITKLEAGMTIQVDLPNQDINNETFELLEVTYNINKSSLLEGTTINVLFSERIKDVTDLLKDISEILNEIRAKDIDDADVIEHRLLAVLS